VKKLFHDPGLSFGCVVIMLMCAIGSEYCCQALHVCIRVPSHASVSGVALVSGSIGFTGHRCCF